MAGRWENRQLIRYRISVLIKTEKKKKKKTKKFLKTLKYRDFPGGPVVKNLPASEGDTGLIPGPGRSHMLWSN